MGKTNERTNGIEVDIRECMLGRSSYLYWHAHNTQTQTHTKSTSGEAISKANAFHITEHRRQLSLDLTKQDPWRAARESVVLHMHGIYGLHAHSPFANERRDGSHM